MASEEEKIAKRVLDKLLGPYPQITLEIRGTEENEQLRLGDFIDQLAALKDALRQTERILYGTEGAIYYRIVELSQNSPAVVTIEAVPRERTYEATPVVNRFFAVIDQLGDSEGIPPEMDLVALDAFRRLAPTKKRGVSALVLRDVSAHMPRQIDRTFAERVNHVIGPDQTSEGSVAGALEMVNLHNQSKFAIFTTIGSRKVTCNFPDHLKSAVIGALEKYVRVTGTLRYKSWDPRPHEIDAKAIDVLPEDERAPDIDALAGINPDIVGDQTPEDFLRAARNAKW